MSPKRPLDPERPPSRASKRSRSSKSSSSNPDAEVQVEEELKVDGEAQVNGGVQGDEVVEIAEREPRDDPEVFRPLGPEAMGWSTSHVPTGAPIWGQVDANRNENWTGVPGWFGETHVLVDDNGEKRNVVQPTFEELPLNERVRISRSNVVDEPHIVTAILYVATVETLKVMLNLLVRLPTDRPWMGFDLEATNLSHKTPLGLMQIRDYKERVTYLVDTFVLSDDAWDTAADDGTTLRNILEDEKRLKLIFDCRQDSCCLYGDPTVKHSRIGIKLDGIVDVQFLHVLLMDGPSDVRKGLSKAVFDMAGLEDAQYAAWAADKDIKNHDGWERRPLTQKQKKYAAGDVELLFEMYLHAERWLTERGMQVAKVLSKLEVESTWIPGDDWRSHEMNRVPSAFRPGLNLKSYWADSDQPLRKRGAPSIEPALFKEKAAGGSEGVVGEETVEEEVVEEEVAEEEVAEEEVAEEEVAEEEVAEEEVAEEEVAEEEVVEEEAVEEEEEEAAAAEEEEVPKKIKKNRFKNLKAAVKKTVKRSIGLKNQKKRPTQG